MQALALVEGRVQDLKHSSEEFDQSLGGGAEERDQTKVAAETLSE